jgi:enoyl-[acyl-carrier protein] reductase II
MSASAARYDRAAHTFSPPAPAGPSSATATMPPASVASRSADPGGIADGRGLAAALMLGADGAWIGTRFVATVESQAHDGYKARLVESTATDTALTAMFGPDNPRFNPMRVLRNRVVREWRDRVAEIPADTSDLPVIGHVDLGGERVDMHRFSNLVPMRELTTGDLEEMALLAGQGVGLVTAVGPAATVVAGITAQARAMLDRFPTV